MKALLPTDLPLPIPLRIISRSPGRVRIRVAQNYREPEMMAQIAEALTNFVAEIDQVRMNPSMGSLTIYYDSHNGNLEDVFITLQELGIIVHDVPAQKSSTETSTFATTVTTTMAGLNQRVHQFTEGSIDLKSLVPSVLVIFAMRQLFAKGNSPIKIVPWYALAWYAFDAFMKFNASQTEVPQASNNSHRRSQPTKLLSSSAIEQK
jgi:hypothetical protein